MNKTEERAACYWCYNDPIWDGDNIIGNKVVTKNENEILEEYFAAWSSDMKKVGKEDMIDEDMCLDDWVVVNWAWKAE